MASKSCSHSSMPQSLSHALAELPSVPTLKLKVVNGPSRASLAHFYMAHGYNWLDIVDY